MSSANQKVDAVKASSAPERWAWMGGIALLLAVGYLDTFEWLWQRYMAAEGYYGHGPLIPFVCAFLVYRDRAALRAAAGRGSWWALPWIAACALLRVVGLLTRIDFLSGVSLWGMLAGLVWLLGGARLLRRLWFPLAFLGFAVPVPMVAVAHAVLALKQGVLQATAFVVSSLGADVRVDGSFLVLPGGGRLLIEEECCGLRSLIALIAIGVLMAGTSRRLSVARRWFLVALAAPFALAANLLRVVLLALVALKFGVGAAQRAHDPSTYAVYAVAIGVYVALERWWARGRVEKVVQS